jgi:type IV pilus assembly protein PilM
MRALNRCLGVDIGTHSVKITELVADSSGVRVVKAVSLDTGVDPAMSPEERTQLLVRTVKDAIKKGRFGTKNAIFGLSGLKVFIRRFRLPATSDERLERIVVFEARQQIPFPPEKTELQWQVFPLEESGEVDVVLVAVRTDEVAEFMVPVEKSGLNAVQVGVSTFALFNAHALMRQTLDAYRRKQEAKARKKKARLKKGEAAPAEEAEPESDMMEEVKGFVNLGATSFDLAVARMSSRSRVLYTRAPAIGGNELTRVIQEHLGVQSFQDAERIKRTSTRLMGFDFGLEDTENLNEEASMAVTDTADRICVEVRRSLDFFMSQPDGMAVDAIEVSGGFAEMPGLQSFLEEKLAMPVTVVSAPPEDSCFKWDSASGSLSPYLVSVGLALQGLGLSEVTMDFLPAERKVVRDFPYKTVAVMLVLLVACVGVSLNAGKELVQKYAREIDNIEQQMLKDQREIAEAKKATDAHLIVAARVETLAKAIGQRDYWLRFLAFIAENKPVDMVVDEITMSHDGEVRIKGVTESQASPVTFVQRINERYGANASRLDDLTSNRVDRRYQKPVYGYEIYLRVPDKANHLQIFPTPVPTGAAAAGGGNRPNANPNANPPGRRSGRGAE